MSDKILMNTLKYPLQEDIRSVRRGVFLALRFMLIAVVLIGFMGCTKFKPGSDRLQILDASVESEGGRVDAYQNTEQDSSTESGTDSTLDAETTIVDTGSDSGSDSDTGSISDEILSNSLVSISSGGDIVTSSNYQARVVVGMPQAVERVSSENFTADITINLVQ